MNRSRRLPPHLSGRAFTTAEGLEAGLSRERLRRADLEHPFRGLHSAAGTTATVESRVVAYSLRMSPDQFFSDVTAAIIHGLPLPLGLTRSQLLHICTEEPASRHGSPGVIGHHIRAGSIAVVEVRGLRATSPVDTWCQLASVLSLDELIKVGDALVRRKNPLATMESLQSAVLRYAGHRGAKRLREAFEWVRPASIPPRRPSCGC